WRGAPFAGSGGRYSSSSLVDPALAARKRNVICPPSPTGTGATTGGIACAVAPTGTTAGVSDSALIGTVATGCAGPADATAPPTPGGIVSFGGPVRDSDGATP